MKVARLENLILYSTVRDFRFVFHMRDDYFCQSPDVFCFCFFFNVFTGLIWSIYWHQCYVSDYSMKLHLNGSSKKIKTSPFFLRSTAVLLSRIIAPLSALPPDNWPSKLWTSVWSAWRTSRPGPAWTTRKTMTRTRSGPTHSRSSPVAASPPLPPPPPLRQGLRGEPAPPQHPLCRRVAAERHPQADLSIRSRASLASRTHLLLGRNQSNTRVQVRTLSFITGRYTSVLSVPD